MKKTIMLGLSLFISCLQTFAWQRLSQNYTSKDFRAHPLIWKFIQDPKGRLWMANNEGALRFDGGNWKLYPTPKAVRSMNFDKKGNLFLACEGDIGMLKFETNGTSKYISFKEKLGSIKASTKGDKNVFLVGSDIYFTSDKHIFKVNESDNNYSIKIIETNTVNGAFVCNNKLYINDAFKGLCILNTNNKIEPIRSGEKMRNKFVIGTCILNNEFIIATNFDGLYKMNGSDITAVSGEINDFALKGLGSISSSGNSKIALGSFSNGVKVYDGNGKEERGIKIPSNEIYSTYFDNEKNLWTAHRKGITYININSKIKEFKDINLNGTITDMLFKDNRLFVCSSVGLYMMSDESQLIPIQGISGECWQMIQTKNSLIIASTNGLFSYQNGDIKNLIPSQTFIHVQQSHLSDKIFAFAQEAIYSLEWKNDNFLVTKLSGIDELANSCFEEQDGTIWIGTYYNGLKKYKNTKIIDAELPEELRDGKCTIKRYENKMLVIAKEKVFLENGNQFIIDEKLSNLFNHASNKNFDFKSSDFVFCNNQIRAYENGKTLESLPIYTINDKPVSICINQNSTWLALEDKIICIEKQNTSNVKPLASINGIKNASGAYIYDSHNVDENSIPKINQNESNFTIEFGINSFINTEKNAYRYRIKQISDTWSEWQKASILKLTGLSSGNYIIELQAKNAEGLISESTELTFQSLAPWYLTRYAIMVYISVGLLMILLIIKLNSKLLLAKNKKLEEIVTKRTIELSEKNVALTDEKKKSDALLLNILPAEVAEELKTNGFAKARQFENVTLIFTDFVNFTGISEKLSPQQLVEELDYCFKGFDEIIERNQLEKIKTIGDAYLAACGMPHLDPKHAIKVIKAAQEILQFVQKRKENGGLFDIRIGIHSGPIIAGIVGHKKYAYDIWGDTVNTAARMEQNSEVHKINISETTYNIAKNNFAFVSRGKIIAKNKGEMSMYYLDV